MEAKYSFLYDYEPSDEQLSELMHDVIISVKERAEEADKLFKESLLQQVKNVKEQYSGNAING